MSEERSCEEAYEEWFDAVGHDFVLDEQEKRDQFAAFAAGAAWARTPTLPAPSEFEQLLASVPPGAHPDAVLRDRLMGAALNEIAAAGDRPSAEREAGVREATELAEAVAGRKFDPPAVISSTSTNREPVATPAPKEGT